MNRKFLIASLLTVGLMIAAGIAYQSAGAKPDPGPPHKPLTSLMTATSGSRAPDREHELKALQSDLEKNPDHVPILLRMAQVSRDMGKVNDSVRYLQDAVRQDSNNKEALLELGRALYETGDVEGAIRETERLVKLDPANVDALYNLGAIYGNLSQDSRAQEYWEKVVTLGPETESGRNARENLKKLN